MINNNTFFNMLCQKEQKSQKTILKESQEINKGKTDEELNKINRYNVYKSIYGNMPGKLNEYTQFNKDVKRDLFSEALLLVLNKSIKTPLYEKADLLKKHLVNNFVNESGINELIEENYDKSLFIGNYIHNVLEYSDIITEKAKSSCEKCVDSEDKENFYDSLNIDDLDLVSNQIHARVASAINRFNMENMQKRREIENALEITKEKINNAETEKLKEHFQTKGKLLEQKIRHKKKSIFESMVYNVLESCYKSNELKNNFFNEDGSPDMDKITDHCKIMYGFLEMLNTLKLKNISEEYIKEQLESLKIK